LKQNKVLIPFEIFFSRKVILKIILQESDVYLYFKQKKRETNIVEKITQNHLNIESKINKNKNNQV